MVRYSFPVGLFHSLLHAGFYRRFRRGMPRPYKRRARPGCPAVFVVGAGHARPKALSERLRGFLNLAGADARRAGADAAVGALHQRVNRL